MLVRKLDGGLSTALEANGNKLTGSLWTGELLRTAPREIEKAHRDFVNAGAQVIITSAYQLSFSGCDIRGWSKSDVISALALSTELARSASSDHDVHVAASVGPYGASLSDGSEYRGRYGVSRSVLREFHKQRLDILIETEPDILALETMPDIEEVEVLLDLLDETGSDIPFWVAYSCKEGNQTNAGQPFREAAQIVAERKYALAVGINCTAPEFIAPLLNSAEIDFPFVVYPNAGRKWDASKKEWIGKPNGRFAPDLLAEWIELGATIIGGCCGVSPRDIEAMELLYQSATDPSS
ncbi:MAG: homocysteine S-methyltransferase [Actinobacteria bacterium]|uniref:Unannotated protein n=1 Tax=freshwater metagenome TaxID=449393 RepID=A0A6J7NDH9_9ZZZZ|nr:homocysteine S-methyltransferase [Actinomycetota bacterium]MSZ68327.1 homocysteine S-methyltransferase [Actinomycetota bacterium]MTA67094.1 homocysteine S-methyltransferase [Actinomycetota bacterium]